MSNLIYFSLFVNIYALVKIADNQIISRKQDGLVRSASCSAVLPDIDGEQKWTCDEYNVQNNVCMLDCIEDYQPNRNNVLVTCFCKNGRCLYIRKYLAPQENMFFRLFPGWIETTGHVCELTEEKTTTEIPTTSETTTTSTATTSTSSTTTTSTSTTTFFERTTQDPSKPTTKSTTTISTTTTTSTTITTTATTTTTESVEILQCRYLPGFGFDSAWICQGQGNECNLLCQTDNGRITNVKDQPEERNLIDETGRAFGLITFKCACQDVLDEESCQYTVDNGIDIVTFNMTEIIDTYSNHCEEETTTTTTTTSTIITTTTTVPIDRCGQLPQIELGYWQCQDNVCIITCPNDETAHLTIALQCICHKEEICAWVKIEPQWLTEFRRFDFELGFENRDGFKCRPTIPPTTTSNPITTTGPKSCDNLEQPELPYGYWACSGTNKYCSFSCPSGFKRNKQFIVKCKCNDSRCAWVKQDPISVDVTNFQFGWHAIEQIKCIAKNGQQLTTTPEITTTANPSNNCTLPETFVGDWRCNSEESTCYLGCPVGQYKNRQVMISCVCGDGRCDYQLYSKISKTFDFIQSKYWLHMLNFKCESRPEMEEITGNGEIGANLDDSEYEESDSTDENVMSILNLIRGRIRT